MNWFIFTISPSWHSATNASVSARRSLLIVVPMDEDSWVKCFFIPGIRRIQPISSVAGPIGHQQVRINVPSVSGWDTPES